MILIKNFYSYWSGIGNFFLICKNVLHIIDKEFMSVCRRNFVGQKLCVFCT